MGRPGGDDRFQRLLVMVPWIMAEDGPLTVDVCARFDITEKDLAADLEMLFLCGLYPFTPDTLIEADIVDGRVWIRCADAFERPPSFTPQEAVALVASASAVLALPGNEENLALRSALTKLSNALGLGETDPAVDVELASASTTTLDLLRTATERHRVVELDYYSYGRDARSLRRISPYQVFNREGQWYVQALAEESGAVRNFRLDRMTSATMTDDDFVPPTPLPLPSVYNPRDDDPVITLDLDDAARWVASQYPVDSVNVQDDGLTRVTLRVSETRWLERLLLRLGNHARVIAGTVDVAAPASRVLARYER